MKILKIRTKFTAVIHCQDSCHYHANTRSNSQSEGKGFLATTILLLLCFYSNIGKACIFEMLYNFIHALAVNVDRVSPGPFFSGLQSSLALFSHWNFRYWVKWDSLVAKGFMLVTEAERSREDGENTKWVKIRKLCQQGSRALFVPLVFQVSSVKSLSCSSHSFSLQIRSLAEFLILTCSFIWFCGQWIIYAKSHVGRRFICRKQKPL